MFTLHRDKTNSLLSGFIPRALNIARELIEIDPFPAATVKAL